MNKKDRARIVEEELELSVPDPHIPLKHRDPYTLLVAVLLSAQCTDARVNLVTPELFALAGNPYDMARQSPETVREIIRSCGLSDRKANSIVELSKILVEQYGGNVPDSFEALESLPGVGHKTASVVMEQAFHIPAFPVDTHIFRLARRWGLSKGGTVEKVESDLKKLYPKEKWGRLHLQMVLYGRSFCPARGCRPPCPVCRRLELNG